MGTVVTTKPNDGSIGTRLETYAGPVAEFTRDAHKALPAKGNFGLVAWIGQKQCNSRFPGSL